MLVVFVLVVLAKLKVVLVLVLVVANVHLVLLKNWVIGIILGLY